ncbi:MAG: HAD hydrolase-like protein [Planctomycetes bacterium]|nr:HAD hydrolase-like protein [Planctomycetota bacterium]
MDPTILFDGVVFDLDGTLVATDRFWVEAARTGARRAFAELGLARELPTGAEWMNLVGMPLAEGFAQLFSDLEPAQRELVMRLCVEEEERALRAGQAALLPGVPEALAELAARGLKLGIASNCGRDYLRTMMVELDLQRFVEEARCLDTPGMRTKTSMVGDLLQTFGTRAVLMVGDRQSDRDAAWANGLPHVHAARGFAQAGEEVACEARIEDMGELVPLLERRASWMAEGLRSLGLLEPGGPRSLGITGHSGSGKTIFARDTARVLAAHGRNAVVVALDLFLKPEADLSATSFWPLDRPLEHLQQGFEATELVEALIAPHAAGQAVDYQRGGTRIQIAPQDVLVLEGLFLLHPLLRARLERVLQLDVADNVCLRRVAGRDAREGAEALMRVRRHFLPVQRAFDERVEPARNADLVLPGGNVFGV